MLMSGSYQSVWFDVFHVGELACCQAVSVFDTQSGSFLRCHTSVFIFETPVIVCGAWVVMRDMPVMSCVVAGMATADVPVIV